MLAAYLDTGYQIVLVAHIVFAIFGFGAVVLNGVYGAQIRAHSRAGRMTESLAVFEANFKVSSIGDYFMYAVFVLGLALVGMSDKTWKFSQTWVWLATALFVVSLGVAQGLLRPRVKKVGNLMRELAAGGPPGGGAGGAPAGPPPQALELQKLGPQVGIIGMTLDVMLVVMVVVMVFKPGAPGFGF